jgi:hypothetical protein
VSERRVSQRVLQGKRRSLVKGKRLRLRILQMRRAMLERIQRESRRQKEEVQRRTGSK